MLSGENDRDGTLVVLFSNTLISLPVPESQRRIFLSGPPEAIYRPSGDTAKELIHVCPLKDLIFLQLCASQIIIL